eukprot:gb/GECH01009387.1/.p1 GENE.gb/GECH01009387.1/~~gb/GECH01009387.1/.p1  ORF type:complete len:301 (+),score=67.71 gb/GECH01009387.1/:1-903(+)
MKNGRISSSSQKSNKTYTTISHGNIKARIHSVSGQSTCISIPQFNVAFDLGKCPLFAADAQHVLFTHTHLDHVGGIAFHSATRELKSLDPPVYHILPQFVNPINRLFESYREINQSQLPYEIYPFEKGDMFPLEKNIYLKSIPTTHTIDSQGYVIFKERSKLKQQYLKLSNSEIQQLKKNDSQFQSMFYRETFPEFAFTGDTTIDAVIASEDLRRARLLVMECTFLNEASMDPQEAREHGHVHLRHLIDHADMFQGDDTCERLVLTHFSPRHNEDDIEEAYNRLPSELKEKVIFCDGVQF